MIPPVLQADQIRARVGFEDLIEPVAQALRDSSARRGRSGMIAMYPGERPELGDVYVKTATLVGHPVYVVKISPWFAVNGTTGRPQGGFIAVFDSATGHTRALLDDQHYLSDIRTAAAGAVAARALAPARVRTAAVLGSGVQAYWQPLALHRERPFETLWIWARHPDRAAALRSRLETALPGVSVRVSSDLEETVRRAEVVITATSSREPLVRGAWLHEGQHLTAVGADDAAKCELDAATLGRALVFVDSVEATVEAGDVARAIGERAYRREELAGELGEVLAGTRPGRRTGRDVTVAKLVGIGAQDLVAAEVTLARFGDGG